MSQSPQPAYTADSEAFFVRVREALPSFVPIDDAGRDEWTDPDGTLGYVRIAALAWHLADVAAQGNVAEVKLVLGIAEATLTSSDAYTRELMVVGLLEDLQNAVLQSEGRVRLVDVRALLGPASIPAWDDLMRSWYGDGAQLPPGSLPDPA
jgi:hypothetical protein